jgi:hypothetical protein
LPARALLFRRVPPSPPATDCPGCGLFFAKILEVIRLAFREDFNATSAADESGWMIKALTLTAVFSV